MKRYASIAAVVLSFNLLYAGSASADQSGTSEIEITGRAAPVCNLSTATQTSSSNANFANGLLTIENLIDQGTANVKAASVQITFDYAMCNYKATISIGSQNGGLTPAEAINDPGNSFLKKVDYTISGSWAGFALPVLNTATNTSGLITKETDGARRGQLVLNISTNDSTIPLIAGQYHDRIALKVGLDL